MSVTEHLMRPGDGAIELDPELPLSVSTQIMDLVNGAGCHIVITPTRFDTSLGDAAILAGAMYTGRVMARPSRTSLEFMGLSTWLDSVNETAITRTAGTPTQWLGDLILNNITAGTVTGGSNVTRTLPAYAQTRREGLDLIADLGNWEYDFRPDFTVNAGTYTNLFESPPTVVITDKAEGPDGQYIGLLGGMLDQNVDASNAATKIVAITQGEGAAITSGSASHVLTLKTHNGNTPVLVGAVNAPSEPSVNASTVAARELERATDALTRVRLDTRNRTEREAKKIYSQEGRDASKAFNDAYRAALAEADQNAANAAAAAAAHLQLSNATAASQLGGLSRSTGGPEAQSQFVRRVLRPGDEVYLYDLKSGLVDTTNQITYRGELICPMLVRCTSMTWAIEKNYGVYVLSNAATRVIIDLTPYVVWEPPGAQIEVSDSTPGSYGRASRSNPALEERIAGSAGPVTSHTPQIDQGATTNIAKTVNTSEYIREGSVVTWWFDLTLTAAGTAGSIVTITLPIDNVMTGGVSLGAMQVYDANTNTRYTGIAERIAAWGITPVGDWSAGTGWGQTPNLALASGDIIRGCVTYRV